MRMIEAGGDADLGEEPLGAEDGTELGAQHLHRHGAVVLEVLREIDRGHPALAQLAVEAVAGGEGVPKLVRRVWQGLASKVGR